MSTNDEASPNQNSRALGQNSTRREGNAGPSIAGMDYLRSKVTVFVSVATLLACSSTAVPGGRADTTSSSGDSGASTGSGTTTTPDMVQNEDGTTVDCSTLERPSTPLRRLTRFEYNNAVADLFATQLTPADDFPPDEVAEGFSNNGSLLTISSLHAEKYTFAAEAIAAEARANLSQILPCDPAQTGEEACARMFAETFGRRVYRRALEPEDIDVLMEAYAVGSGFDEGVEVMTRAMLQSPHFLFRVEFTGSDTPGAGMMRLDGYETAARLSFLIWSSVPDEALLDAAATGQLSTQEQVAAQARRMLANPKAKNAVAEFYRQWLETNRLDIISKDVASFPLWSEAMRSAMKDESDAIVGDVVFGDDPSLERLLTAPLGLPTGPLAQLYQVAEGSEVTVLDAEQRAGILTSPGFMSVQAHPDQTSPVLRGKFVREKLLCKEVQPPPDNVDVSAPDPAEGGTARERFGRHAEDAFCAECHALMDPLGYTFETYDAVGAFRTTDQGMTLDLTGEFVKTKSLDGPFNGVHEMVDILASGDEVSDCVAEQWFTYAVGRGTKSGDACSLSPLQEQFAQGGSNLLELIVSTTQTEAFLYRRATSGGVSP